VAKHRVLDLEAASLVRANFKKYRRSPSITDHRVFPARSHWLCGERGWEEIADYALTWAMGRAAGESVRDVPTARA
jgi:hypothetical protein